MDKQESIKIDGCVDEVLPGGNYRVKLDQGLFVVARIAGKMHMNSIKVVEGDRVTVEVSPYDLTKGRIVYRIR